MLSAYYISATLPVNYYEQQYQLITPEMIQVYMCLLIIWALFGLLLLHWQEP